MFKWLARLFSSDTPAVPVVPVAKAPVKKKPAVKRVAAKKTVATKKTVARKKAR